MFSTTASRTLSLFQPAQATAARCGLAPAAGQRLRPPSRDGGGPGGTPVRSRSVSFAAATSGGERDWPAAGDAWDGTQGITTGGALARRAADQAPPSRQAVFQAREAHAVLRGEGTDPVCASVITRIGMVRGLERTRDELLAFAGPGVGAGLRRLAIEPGDAVGEHDPADLGLPVHLALEGAHTFISLTYPSRHHDISRELARYRAGQVGRERQVGSDGQPERLDSYYAQASSKASRHLSVRQGAGFGALPHDRPFKALISRGVFQHLDTPEIEASVRCAARMLAPGGGLVFEFAHAASQPAPDTAGVQFNKISFRQIEEAIRQAGLQLHGLYVTFRWADKPRQQAIPTRRVTANEQPGICLRRADAAAWSGWDEIFRQPSLHGRPVRIDASGLLLKPEK